MASGVVKQGAALKRRGYSWVASEVDRAKADGAATGHPDEVRVVGSVERQIGEGGVGGGCGAEIDGEGAQIVQLARVCANRRVSSSRASPGTPPPARAIMAMLAAP